MSNFTVGVVTSGGIAPCLSSSIAYLIYYWSESLKNKKISSLKIRMYKDGYKGILTGDSFDVPSNIWDSCVALHDIGGSPIGNSRVKLMNSGDCIRQGYILKGENPLEVASRQLIKDGVNVLHTIGGDDTNTQAAILSEFITEKHKGKITVVGMPKTIDNDIYPIKQTFGSNTSADQGALFFENVVSESTANPRTLIIHECMGRDSGYLTAATAKKYRERLKSKTFVYPFSTTMTSRDVHAVWIPEIPIDIESEGSRLKKIMDKIGNVNIFLCEGSGLKEIITEMENNGQEVPRDAYGHVSLGMINPGIYFSKRISSLVVAEKTLVQKSGYFARSAVSNQFDRDLIDKCARVAIDSAINGISGCMGEDQEMEGNPIRPIEFSRIKGGKPFNVNEKWFQEMLCEIGQTT